LTDIGFGAALQPMEMIKPPIITPVTHLRSTHFIGRHIQFGMNFIMIGRSVYH
jgi:hypothetical protein